MNPEDEAYLLVKRALDMRSALQSAAIAAARMRRVGQLGYQGSQLLHLTPQYGVTPQAGGPNSSPMMPYQSSSASMYAPVGIPLEGAN